MDNNAKLELFRQARQEQADAEAKSIIADMRSKKAAAGRTQEEIDAKVTLNGIKTEITRSRTAFRKEMSKCDYDMKKSVLMYRSKLISEFFDDIEAKLKSFVDSAEYESFLRRSLEKIRASIAIDSATVIYARPCDVDIVRTMTSCEVTSDSNIQLGGLRAMCRVKNVLCDVTLDVALQEEMRAFADKSELSL